MESGKKLKGPGKEMEDSMKLPSAMKFRRRVRTLELRGNLLLFYFDGYDLIDVFAIDTTTI